MGQLKILSLSFCPSLPHLPLTPKKLKKKKKGSQKKKWGPHEGCGRKVGQVHADRTSGKLSQEDLAIVTIQLF